MRILSRLCASFGSLLLVGLACVFPFFVHAQTNTSSVSRVCTGSNCTAAEVGPFMQGITANCYNKGECQIEDFLAVFANVGNWIAGIIGIVVFALYVWGGFHLLLAGGSSERVQKGKTIMLTATIGLIIVFGAYIFVATLSCTLLPASTIQNLTGPAFVKNICQ